MYGMMYGYCPICGVIHDDGTVFEYKEKMYFLCLDCAENMTQKEIYESLERIQGK